MNKTVNKIIEIIEKPKDKKIIEEIAKLSEKLSSRMSAIQIENFVLNDVEFPTPYGKFKQTKAELSHRFNQLIDLYYEVKEKEIKIKQKERDIKKTKDELEKELLNLQKEKLEIQRMNLLRRVKVLLEEIRIFWNKYQQTPEFHNLTKEEEFKLEAEDWAKKTLNMPTIFEERYGKDYMIKALGKENYEKYLEIRKKVIGLLPREMFEVKMLPKNKNSES